MYVWVFGEWKDGAFLIEMKEQQKASCDISIDDVFRHGHSFQ